jgi:polyisoprenyl-teichoic acid--peptidoglycan teichoic acid transferase
VRPDSYTEAMAGPARGSIVASVCSFLLPGAGQLYAGARKRGLVLLALAAALLVVTVALAAAWPQDVVDRRLAAGVLAANAALLALRLFAVLDVWRGGAIGVAALAALTAAPHLAAGWVTVRSYGVLEEVFAGSEPADVLRSNGVFLAGEAVPLPHWVAKDAWQTALVERLGPGETAPLDAGPRVLAGSEQAGDTRPWTTILLLGTDEGPGNWGARTDTIILAAIQHGTGRTVAFGIPRNLAQVPLGARSKPLEEPINALYGMRGGGQPGASAVKQAVSRLLGVRVDYYALVNLLGFADLVDALGGVEIRVKERLHDEVTRPAWGEPKPTIDVVPGRTYRFYGREALAYVRSRKDSSDYTRMARQRCFLSALADQVDPVRVLRNFGSLAKTVETNVRTDIPLNRLPSLVRLAGGIEPRDTITITFGPDYFFGRQKRGNYPVPNLRRIRTTARRAIAEPALLQRTGPVATAQATC